MTRLALILIALLATTSARAQEGTALERWQADHTVIVDAAEVTLDDLEWVARPVVIFADSPAQPQFREQMRLIEADIAALALRDVMVIVDTDPGAGSDARRVLRPRGFSLVLIDKDGRVNLRKDSPWAVREIQRQIDRMPLRIEELRAGAG